MKRVALVLFAGLILSPACGLAAPVTPTPTEEKEGTIDGTAIKRDGDGWLGVQIKNGTFQLTFYNVKKKPVAADKTSAVFRWAVHYQPNDERTELSVTGDPAVLSSTYPVKPPYSFKLHIALLSDSSKDAEGYVVDFGG
jgi:hypothetical protein